ncbi:MAG TPA: helix-turn-helix transcriptional regulator [Solirubrobacteraceae bacterium]|jgi:DNA-binding XRE family transcriptional regulator|nr:helix-turn-helix transcriptional regulator [Solirubrobacteraceae bacterium]
MSQPAVKITIFCRQRWADDPGWQASWPPARTSFFYSSVVAERRRLRLTQEELAYAAGLHRTYVGAVERGEANVTLDVVDQIASALGVLPCQLVCPATP